MASKRCKNCREQRQGFGLEFQGEAWRHYASSCTRCNRNQLWKEQPGFCTEYKDRGTVQWRRVHICQRGGQKSHKGLESLSNIRPKLHILSSYFDVVILQWGQKRYQWPPSFLETCLIPQDSLLLNLNCWQQHHTVKFLGDWLQAMDLSHLSSPLKHKYTGFKMVFV